MVRFYIVQRDGQPIAVILQDQTGIYMARPRDKQWQQVGIALLEEPAMRVAYLPEWPAPREVLTTSAEYLAFKQRMEQGAYANITHSPIETVGLTLREAALMVAQRIEPHAALV